MSLCVCVYVCVCVCVCVCHTICAQVVDQLPSVQEVMNSHFVSHAEHAAEGIEMLPGVKYLLHSMQVRDVHAHASTHTHTHRCYQGYRICCKACR